MQETNQKQKATEQPEKNQFQKPKYTLVSDSYKQLGQIKISFKFLHDFIKEVNKLQLNLPADTKLIEVKKKLDQLSKKNFLFYLKESFMPSLDSKIGDLAQCYGRFQTVDGVKKYQITFAASMIKDQYG